MERRSDGKIRETITFTFDDEGQRTAFFQRLAGLDPRHVPAARRNGDTPQDKVVAVTKPPLLPEGESA